jgi:hypothetical protein
MHDAAVVRPMLLRLRGLGRQRATTTTTTTTANGVLEDDGVPAGSDRDRQPVHQPVI